MKKNTKICNTIDPNILTQKARTGLVCLARLQFVNFASCNSKSIPFLLNRLFQFLNSRSLEVILQTKGYSKDTTWAYFNGTLEVSHLWIEFQSNQIANFVRTRCTPSLPVTDSRSTTIDRGCIFLPTPMMTKMLMNFTQVSIIIIDNINWAN